MNPTIYQKIFALLDRAEYTPVEDGDFEPIKHQLALEGISVSESDISQVYSHWVSRNTSSVPNPSPVRTSDASSLPAISPVDMDDLIWKLETLEVEQSPTSKLKSKNEFLPNPFSSAPRSTRGLEDIVEALSTEEGLRAKAIDIHRPGMPRSINIEGPKVDRSSFTPARPASMLTGKRSSDMTNLRIDIPYEGDSSSSQLETSSPPSPTSSVRPLLPKQSPEIPPKSILRKPLPSSAIKPTDQFRLLPPPSIQTRPSTSASSTLRSRSRFSEILPNLDHERPRPSSSHTQSIPPLRAKGATYRSAFLDKSSSSSSNSSDELYKGKSKLFSLPDPRKIFASKDLEARKEEASRIARESAKRHEDKVGAKMKRFWDKVKGRDRSLEAETRRYMGTGERLRDDEDTTKPAVSEAGRQSAGERFYANRQDRASPPRSPDSGKAQKNADEAERKKKSVKFDSKTVFNEREKLVDIARRMRKHASMNPDDEEGVSGR